MKREKRHDETLRRAINGLKVSPAVRTILRSIVAEVDGAWLDHDARLCAEVKRLRKLMRAIESVSNDTCIWELCAEALKPRRTKGKR